MQNQPGSNPDSDVPSGEHEAAHSSTNSKPVSKVTIPTRDAIRSVFAPVLRSGGTRLKAVSRTGSEIHLSSNTGAWPTVLYRGLRAPFEPLFRE
jgi:hypothetical protein